MKFPFYFFLFFSGLLHSQETANVLFTVNEKPVYTSEFLRIYNKNKETVIDSNPQNLESYLELFIDFKLKLEEAYQLNLNENLEFKEELKKYRDQLAESYIKNEEIREELVKETYERMKFEVNASHILVKLEPNAAAEDTLKAFEKISQAYNKVKAGIPFEEVAVEYSEDPSVKQNKGNLSYFSVFEMVYDFENMGYTTAVGEVSKPFRTQFGYHILKVNDKRVNQGEIEIAHIFIKKDSLNADYAKTQAGEIHEKILQGEEFEYLAKKYSDDQTSAPNGGLLPRFGSGRMIQPMEDQAFALKEIDEVSKPFESPFGWHIFKLKKKYPLLPYAQMKGNIFTQLQNGNRSVILKKELAQKLSKGYEINSVSLKQLDDLLSTNSVTPDKFTILSIQNRNFTLKEFQEFAKKFNNLSNGQLLEDFKNEKIIEYYKNDLDNVNQEFKETLKEYKDGLLLFDLLEEKIWKKAELDSVGLQNFFLENQKNYFWKKSVKGFMADCNQLEKAEIVRDMMIGGKSTDQIKEKVNEGATIYVLFSPIWVELPSEKLPENVVLKKGVSQIYVEENNHFIILNIKEILDPKPKTLEENRGQVLNDYQNYLEREWVKSLREKYKVVINEGEVKKLKNKL